MAEKPESERWAEAARLCVAEAQRLSASPDLVERWRVASDAAAEASGAAEQVEACQNLLTEAQRGLADAAQRASRLWRDAVAKTRPTEE